MATNYDIELRDKIALGLEDLLGGVNAARVGAAERMVQAMHRTCQQSTMRFFMTYVQALAKAGKEERFDLRNEASVKLAQAIMKLPEAELGLPYI